MNKALAVGAGGGAGGIIAAAIIAVLSENGVQLSAETAALCASALGIVLTYIFGWLPKPGGAGLKALLPLLVLILAMPLLGACAAQVAAADAATTAALDSTRAALDVEARALAAAPCKMSLGAWLRMENPERRMAVAVLCQAP